MCIIVDANRLGDFLADHTSDRNLKDDFKRKDLIDRPRGSVYSGAANADLLAKARCRPA